MATLKWKNAQNVWEIIYKNILGSILKRANNLADIENTQVARTNLGISGNDNTTHFHDSRYYTEQEVNNIKTELEQEINTLSEKLTNTVGTQITAQIQKAILDAHPVGSYYISEVQDNPGDKFGGGSWTQIQGRFLFAADSDHPIASTGGEENHQLTVGEMPSHGHIGRTTVTDISGRLRGRSNTLYNDGQTSGTLGHALADGCFTVLETRLRSEGNADDNRTEYVVKFDGTHSHGASIDNVGGNVAHNNMPPYKAVYMWKRTA